MNRTVIAVFHATCCCLVAAGVLSVVGSRAVAGERPKARPNIVVILADDMAFIAPHFPLHALPQDIARYRDTYLEGWDVMRQKRFARQKALGIVNTT